MSLLQLIKLGQENKPCQSVDDDQELQQVMNKLKDALNKKLSYQNKRTSVLRTSQPRISTANPLLNLTAKSISESLNQRMSPDNKKQMRQSLQMNQSPINNTSHTKSKFYIHDGKTHTTTSTTSNKMHFNKMQAKPYTLKELQQNFHENRKANKGFDMEFLRDQIDQEFDKLNPWKGLTEIITNHNQHQNGTSSLENHHDFQKMQEYIDKISIMKTQLQYDLYKKHQKKYRRRRLRKSLQQSLKQSPGSARKAETINNTPRNLNKDGSKPMLNNTFSSQVEKQQNETKDFSTRGSPQSKSKVKPTPENSSKLLLFKLVQQQDQNGQSKFLKLHKDQMGLDKINESPQGIKTTKHLGQDKIVYFQSEGFQLNRPPSKAQLSILGQQTTEITDPKSRECNKKNQARLMALKKGLMEIQNRYEQNQMMLEKAQRVYMRFNFRRSSDPTNNKPKKTKLVEIDTQTFSQKNELQSPPSRPKSGFSKFYHKYASDKNKNNEDVKSLLDISSPSHTPLNDSRQKSSIAINQSLYDKQLVSTKDLRQFKHISTHQLCKSPLNSTSNKFQIYNHSNKFSQSSTPLSPLSSSKQLSPLKKNSSKYTGQRSDHLTNLNKILDRLCQPDYYPNLDLMYNQYRSAKKIQQMKQQAQIQKEEQQKQQNYFKSQYLNDNEGQIQDNSQYVRNFDEIINSNNQSQLLMNNLDIHQMKLKNWKQQIQKKNLIMQIERNKLMSSRQINLVIEQTQNQQEF